MGETCVIFTDATTAEAITTLKKLGYYEISEGGCFLNNNSAIRVYTVWGKAQYYPALLETIPFIPRIQIHFKVAKEDPMLLETVQACAQGLCSLASETCIKAFDAGTGEEITSAQLKK